MSISLHWFRASRDTRLTAADWDAAFAAGRWDYLAGRAEMARTAVIAGYLRAAAPPAPAILDIGCGEGVLAGAIAGSGYRSYVGIDLSAVAVARARERAGEHDRFAVADAATYAPETPPDVVVFNEVLYYFADPAAAAARYLALLAPGGIAVASVYRKRRTERVWRALARVADIADCVTIAHDHAAWRVALLTPRRPRSPAS